MDFSSCINFDEIEKLEPKTKLQPRRSSLKVCTTELNPEKPEQKSQSVYSTKAILDISPFVQSLNNTRVNKNLTNRIEVKAHTRYFNFEGYKLKLGSLKKFNSSNGSPLVKHKNLSPIGIKQNSKNFRRLRWTHGNLGSKSFLVENEGYREKKLDKKGSFRVRNRKVELLPQTRANGILKLRLVRPELRINGVMKDFVTRENGNKAKESANLTDS